MLYFLMEDEVSAAIYQILIPTHRARMSDDLTILDATGLRCPLPVLRARKMLKDVDAGKLLDVFATDTAAPADFEAFCRETGHSLVNIEQVGEIFKIRLRKAETG